MQKVKFHLNQDCCRRLMRCFVCFLSWCKSLCGGFWHFHKLKRKKQANNPFYGSNVKAAKKLKLGKLHI